MMRRNSLSKNDPREITPHSHAASVIKPPSPAEAREMAKNLQSRKAKLITKHLRQSRVISVGVVVVLACLLSAGAIEVYLRCFLPAEISVPSSNISGDTGERSGNGENLSTGSGNLSTGGGSGSGKNQGVGSKGSKPEKPVENSPIEEESEPDDGPNGSGESAPVRPAPVESGDDNEIPPTGLTPNPAVPKLTCDASTQTCDLEEESDEEEEEMEKEEKSDDEEEEDVEIFDDDEDLSADDTPVDYFAGFITDPGTIDASLNVLIISDGYIQSRHKIDSTKDLISHAPSFTFIQQTSAKKISNGYLIAENIIKWAIRTPIYAALNFATTLKEWLNTLETYKKNQICDMDKLHEFAAVWNEMVKTVRAHPLHSPFLKSVNNEENLSGLGLTIVEFMGERLESTPRTDLPLLNTVAYHYNLSPKDLLNLIELIRKIELVVHGESHVLLMREFDICYLREDGSGLLYPVNCFNFHIHYYNDLVTLLKPQDLATVLKLF